MHHLLMEGVTLDVLRHNEADGWGTHSICRTVQLFSRTFEELTNSSPWFIIPVPQFFRFWRLMELFLRSDHRKSQWWFLRFRTVNGDILQRAYAPVHRAIKMEAQRTSIISTNIWVKRQRQISYISRNAKSFAACFLLWNSAKVDKRGIWQSGTQGGGVHSSGLSILPDVYTKDLVDVFQSALSSKYILVLTHMDHDSEWKSPAQKEQIHLNDSFDKMIFSVSPSLMTIAWVFWFSVGPRHSENKC